MLANRQNHLLFTLMLGVGLLSGCEEEPAELETMFPDLPSLDVIIEQEDGAPLEECVNQCCGFPDDGIVVLHLELTNWVLAPHEECGNEPQCGPVVIFNDDAYGRDFEIETVEPTVAINVRDIAAGQDPSYEPVDLDGWRWYAFAHVVPRQAIDYPDGSRSVTLDLRDDAGLRERDQRLCNREDDRFTAYAEFGPATAPGTYVMRANFDDVEVVCEVEVFTNEDGLAEVDEFYDPCTPAGVVSFGRGEVAETPDAPAGTRRAVLSPREAVERASLEVSRDGEILAEGSLEVAGELTSPAGEECTIVPCQIAESLRLAL
jgi:hypothetical protein